MRREYGLHADEALAIHDEAAVFIRQPIEEILLLRPPEEVGDYLQDHVPKLPERLKIRRDSFFAALVPEDDRWKLEGWRCRCGSSNAIFMNTCTQRPDSFKVWCAECTRFAGLASEAEFIFALDHQDAIEVLNYSDVAALRRKADFHGRTAGAGWRSDDDMRIRTDPIDSEFPDLEADERRSESILT